MIAKKPIKKLVLGSLMIALAALLIPLIGCSGGARHCYLCGGFRYERPCVIELSTGNIAELKPASNGIAMFTSVGKISARSSEPNSVTVMMPVAGDVINRSKFCDSCLDIIDRMPNNGYLLADLRDLNNIELSEIKDGASLNIADYAISIHTDMDSKLVLEVTGPG